MKEEWKGRKRPPKERKDMARSIVHERQRPQTEPPQKRTMGGDLNLYGKYLEAKECAEKAGAELAQAGERIAELALALENVGY
jgi:hypothetical protein